LPSADRGEEIKDEASYNCDSSGEKIVVPIDLTAGSYQEYVEDCPVCCCPNVIHVEIDDEGDVRVGRRAFRAAVARMELIFEISF
jgi:hypothetical protein